MLPRLVEYLLSVRRKDGSRIVGAEAVQITVPVAPPGIPIHYTITPNTGVYANIGYLSQPDSSMIPNTWAFSLEQSGVFLFSGIIDSAVLQSAWPTWIWVTHQQPVFATITNVSGLYQRWRFNSYYLLIPSEESYHDVIRALERLTKVSAEELAVQANNLRRKMA